MSTVSAKSNFQVFMESIQLFFGNIIKYLKKSGELIEDFIALLVAMGVDFLFNFVFFSFISVDAYTQVGFSAIVFLIVFYKVRALSKAKRRFSFLWLILSILTFYGGLSFSLLDIKYQADNINRKQELIEKAKTDSELKRLDQNIKTKQDSETDLQRQYREAVKRETMDQLYALWQNAVKQREQSERDRRDYYELIIDAKKITIKAEDAFTAIPDAIKRGVYVEVLFLALIFFSIEAAVWTTVTTMTTNRRRREAFLENQKTDIDELKDNLESFKSNLLSYIDEKVKEKRKYTRKTSEERLALEKKSGKKLTQDEIENFDKDNDLDFEDFFSGEEPNDDIVDLFKKPKDTGSVDLVPENLSAVLADNELKQVQPEEKDQAIILNPSEMTPLKGETKTVQVSKDEKFRKYILALTGNGSNKYLKQKIDAAVDASLTPVEGLKMFDFLATTKYNGKPLIEFRKESEEWYSNFTPQFLTSYMVDNFHE